MTDPLFDLSGRVAVVTGGMGQLGAVYAGGLAERGMHVAVLDVTTGDTPDGVQAYACDVVYGTNSEFGFDYLRDNMSSALEYCVQRKHSFAIVDEVDNILIDEARTPLIISGAPEAAADLYYTFARLAKQLVGVQAKEKLKSLGEDKDTSEVDYDYEFGTSSNALMSVMPTGMSGHSSNGIVEGIDSTFVNPTNIYPFGDATTHNPFGSSATCDLHGSEQMMYGTQHQRRREGEMTHQGRPAAVFNAATPGAMPTQPFSTQERMPGGSANKKQRRA